MNAKNPSGLGIRKRTNAHHSLPVTWRGVAAEQIEASSKALGEIGETFAVMNVALGEIDADLHQIADNLHARQS